MSKYLVVIESPGKLASFRKYLGPEFDIEASYGHVADLPEKGGLGVDIKKEFSPTFVVSDDKREVVNRIVEKAKNADLTYLMTDLDREGEGISWLLSQQFPSSVKYCRATTASITKAGILEAINNPRKIDQHMVSSFVARRILDRIVGWKTSWPVKQATGGQSAGRVQSAALRILADREREIKTFIPVEYWPVDAELLTQDKKKFVAVVVDPEKMQIKNEAIAKTIKGKIEAGPIIVATYDTKVVNSNSFPPFTTSQLQARASSMFGWSQKQTMDTAQKLYEGGHITYMRTDSTYIVPAFTSAIREEIGTRYGDRYRPEKPVFYKGGKNAQEAHEAIRPTHIGQDSVGTGNEEKLYKMIWKRTVASQMTPEVREQVRATFRNGKNGDICLASSGSRQVFDGWKKCWNYSESQDTFLPLMKEGDKVDVIEVSYEQKFTEPPPRYGIATFNTKLEDLGIARPSTLATVTKTLQDRKYIETVKNSHHVTDLGMRVTDFLVKGDFCFADPTFTRQMEDDLDDILQDKKSKLNVLTAFWDRLKGDIERAGVSTKETAKSEHACPTCAKEGLEKYLVKRFSKFGEFYSCENYKKCNFKADVGEDGVPKEKVVKPKEVSGFKCPKCGKDMLKRKGFSEFLGCSGFPRCKEVANMDGTAKTFTGKPGKFKKWKKKGQ